MQVTITTVITSCWDCPYCKSDRNAESYCNNDETCNGFHEYQLYRENQNTLTGSCPIVQEQGKERSKGKK